MSRQQAVLVQTTKIGLLWFARKFAQNYDTTLDTSTIIEEFGNIHYIFFKYIAKLNSPREIFTPDHKIDPADLAVEETNLRKTFPEYVETPPLHTQLPSQYLPPVDTPNPLDTPPQSLREDTSDATRVVSYRNIPIYCLTESYYKLFGMFTRIVFTKILSHTWMAALNMMVCGKRYGKSYFFCPPNDMMYRLARSGSVGGTQIWTWV